MKEVGAVGVEVVEVEGEGEEEEVEGPEKGAGWYVWRVRSHFESTWTDQEEEEVEVPWLQLELHPLEDTKWTSNGHKSSSLAGGIWEKYKKYK